MLLVLLDFKDAKGELLPRNYTDLLYLLNIYLAK